MVGIKDINSKLSRFGDGRGCLLRRLSRFTGRIADELHGWPMHEERGDPCLAFCWIAQWSGFFKGNQLVVAFRTEDILKMNDNILNEVVVVGHLVVLKNLFPFFELMPIANEKIFKLLAPCCVGQCWFCVSGPIVCRR